jgi:streptomycin 6-kinase
VTLGDPAFDWAFFIVYFDLARDPVPRLHAASLVSRIGIRALAPWCLRLCLDGLLYYREASDDREHRMEEVMSALAAECPKPS